MKILRGRRRVTHLKIVFSTQLQVSLQPRARVFWSLSLVTMRQQHHDSRRLLPLVFRSCDVLIDDRLRAVTKISKLRFPQNECALRNDRIPVLKPQHAFFRQRAVKHFKSRVGVCRRTKLRQRRPRFSGLRVEENSVTLAERSATRILPTQTHPMSIEHERSKRHCFRKSPIERRTSIAHLSAP